MRKKLLTLLLAVCITGLYTFGDAAAIFAETGEATGTGNQVEQNVDSTGGDQSGDQVDSSTQAGQDQTSDKTEESNKDQTEESKDAATTEQPTTDEQMTTDENKDTTNETKEVSYPAKTFEDTIDGTKVTVDAPEGAFPEGTTMELSKVDNNDVKDLVEKAAGTEVTSMQAIDISFHYNGKEVEPKKEVNIKFSDVDFDGAEGLKAYHLIDNNTKAEAVGTSASATEVSLNTDGFSIYVITPEGTPKLKNYKFYNEDGSKLLSEQTVKTGDKLLEPETPTKEGFKFVGWKIQGSDNYFTAFGEQTVADGDEVNLCADFKQAYYVFFMDGTGENARVVFTKDGAANDKISTIGVMLPLASNFAVTGWYTDKELTDKVDSVTLTDSNITLYPKVEEGRFITFDANGGSYTEPKFVSANEKTTAPTEPTRLGYKFVKWVDDNGNAFTFGESLPADLTLHAVWEADNASYTVMHWQENANDDKYSLKDTETETGIAEENTEATAKSYDGFTVKSFAQTTIKGDGSTIVNIYYDRNQYTVKFMKYSGGWFGSWKEMTNLTITAKYGANISDKWPNSTASIWGTDKDGDDAAAPYQSSISIMPLYGDTFYYKNQNGYYTMNLNYYTQTLNGAYTLNHTDSFKTNSPKLWSTTKEDHYDIEGFTYTNNVPDDSSFAYGGYNNYNVDFRYTRNSYDINFVNSGSIENTKTYQYQADISNASYTPTRPSNIPEGYEFQGWYDNEQCAGGQYVFSGATMPASSITLYAKWAAPKYTAKAHLSIDGNGTKDMSVTYGGKVDQNDMPTVVDSTGKVISQGDDTYQVTVPEGYKWIGWTTKGSDDSYNVYNFSTETYKDIDLYPYYINEAKYNVMYDANGGSGTASDSMKYASGSYAEVASGITLTPPENKVFLNWNTAADGSGTTYYPKDKVLISNNVTLYAQYGDVDSLVTLTYHANYPSDVEAKGSTENTISAVKNNSSITVAGNSFNEASSSYNFEGWNTKADGSGTSYAPDATINIDNNGSNDLYAVWSEKKALDIVITGNHASEKYDGSEQSVSGYTVSALPDGVSVSLKDESTAVASGKNAGTYQMNLTSDDFIVSGADNYKVSVKVNDGSLDIAKRNVTLTSATASKKYDGKPLVNATVEVGGDKFVTGEGATCNVTGSQKYVGSSNNVFTYTLNEGTKAGNYTITTAEGTLTVTNRDAKYEITVEANSGSKKYDGQELKVSGLKATKFTIDGEEYTVSGLTAEAKATDAGTYPVNVTGTAVVKDATGTDVTGQFTVNTENGSLDIAKRNVTLTSATASKKYDGKPLVNATVEVGGDKFVTGEGATCNVTGSQKYVGSSNNVFTYTLNEGTKAGNYTITTAEGTLTVTNRDAKYEITVEANSGSKKYDGQELKVSGLKATKFTIDGEEYTVSGLTAEAKATDAGTYPVNVTGTAVVKDATGTDVTGQFTVNTENGSLDIAKRNVTLTSATASKKYDGKPLVNATVEVGGDKFVTGEGATCNVTGSQKYVGSSNNVFTYTLNEGTKAGNYTITTAEGTLTVTNRDAKYEITVEANSGSKKYDGQELKVSGLKATKFTIDGEEYTVSGLTAEAKATDAGTYPVNVTGTAVVKDATGTDVTGQFTVNTENGSLDIAKRNVTLTSATASKKYDGKPLVNATVEVGGDKFVTGEGATCNVTGSQKYVGSSNNVFTYTLNEGTKAGNYTITTAEGTLTVTNRDAKYEITVEANSGSKKYDGQELKVSGLKATKFTIDGEEYTVSGLTAEAKATDAGTYPVNVTGTAVVKDATGTDVTGQFTVNTENGSLDIAKRNVTLTSATASKKYDGKPLVNATVEVGGDKFVTGEGATCNVTGSQKYVGSSNNVFTYTLNEGTKAGNYTITTAEGTLTVTNRDAKYEITVEANSGSKKYDGQELKVSGLKATKFTIDGEEYTVSGLTAEAKATDAGTYPVNVTGTAVVKDATGTDVTGQFTVNTENGSLDIAKRNVTLTSATASKKYDGKPLVNATVEVGGDKFVTGEGATCNVTGSQKYVGSSNNVFTYTLNEGTKAGNYTITTAEGTLTVTNRDAKYEITVEANSGSKKYDGQELKVSGLKATKFTIDGEEYTVSGLTAEAKATDAGTYPVNVTGTAVVKDATGTDVTGQFTVNTENGSLDIAKRNVTLTSATDSKPFDDTALTNHNVAVGGDGFVEGQGSTYDVTGSQTKVGNSKNTFTYTLNEGTKAGNYTITKTEGTLTVTDRTEKYEITLETNSDTVKYDGIEHSVSGFKTLTFTVDGHDYTVSNVTASVTKTYAGVYPLVISSVDQPTEVIAKALGMRKASTSETPETATTNNAAVSVNGAIVKDANGIDVTDQFDVKAIINNLTINKRTVTLTSATDSKVHDGTALTNHNVVVSGEGFAKDEGAAYNVTGSQTDVGSSDNTFTYTLNTNTKALNYEISTVPGTLTVTPAPTPNPPVVQSTTYTVVANYFTSTDKGSTYKQDNTAAVQVKGATSVNVGAAYSVEPDAAWATYNSNDYVVDPSKSTLSDDSADADSSKNVLVVNYYRITGSNDNGGDNNNNNNNNNNGGNTNNNSNNNNSGNTNNHASNNNASGPNTGDDTNLGLWTSIGVIGSILAGIMFELRKRQEEND